MSNKLSKERSILLIEHACLIAGSNKLVADLLNLEPPRISECKKGARCLTTDEETKLLEEYGQPLTKPGLYIEAAAVESFTEFFEQSDTVSKKRHLEKWITALNANRKNIASCFQYINDKNGKPITYSNQSINPLDKLLKQALPIKTNEQPKPKFSDILGVIKHETFIKWLDYALEKFYSLSKRGENIILIYYQLKSNDIDNKTYRDLNKTLEDMNLRIVNPLGAICMLIPYGYVINNLEAISKSLEINPPIQIDKSGKINSFSPEQINEYVVTGKLIWHKEIAFENAKNGLVFDDKMDLRSNDCPAPFSAKTEHFHHSENLETQNYRSLQTAITPDKWSHCDISLFLNEGQIYSIVIKLFNNTQHQVHDQRTVIIPKIMAHHLFQQLDSLRGWAGLKTIPTKEMKAKIAKAGGYIPGTIVI